MNPKHLRIGVIGAGARGSHAIIGHLGKLEGGAELVAIAEPDQANAEKCVRKVACQATAPTVYSDWRVMLEKEDRFDGMVIATPNHLHHSTAVACIQSGIPAIALEKPLATCEEDCGEIVKLALAGEVKVLLGFTLRSTPFYKKVKELLDAGAVGRIVSVEADELVSFNVTSILFRSSWRRYRRYSGGALLEKCCHDLDLLNWFVGARPVSINSYGGQTVFASNPSLPEQCGDCGISGKCAYFHAEETETDVTEKEMSRYMRETDVCIYNSGSDCVDHQSVQILYENGVVCNFLMNYNVMGERGGRNLHVIGTNGRIWGNLTESVVYQYENATKKMNEHRLVLDGSGHGGGDRIHALNFLRLISDKYCEPIASVFDGYLSAMMCFAADRSMAEGRRVSLRYPASDTIEIA